MKIRILKDIPGYKAGKILENFEGAGVKFSTGGALHVGINTMVAEGFAEEVKDEIDMEEMRKDVDYIVNPYRGFGPGFHPELSDEEAKWFTAYRIVKAVTDTLNGDWTEKWNREQANCFPTYQNSINKFQVVKYGSQKMSIIPHCKDEISAEKVIELCQPELKILFGVK